MRIGLMAVLFAAGCAAGDGITAEDKQAVMNTLTASMGAAHGGAPPRGDVELPQTTAAFNKTLACPAAGHITMSGNVTVYSNAVTVVCNVDYGDRSNNLNDCQFSNGLVIDGTLHMTAAAYSAGYTHWQTAGTLTLGRKGPTDGIVPLDSCLIDIAADTRTRKIQGDVCGDYIDQAF